MLGRDGRGAKEKNTVSRAREPQASPLSERGVLGRGVQCGHRRWTKEKRFEKALVVAFRSSMLGVLVQQAGAAVVVRGR